MKKALRLTTVTVIVVVGMCFVLRCSDTPTEGPAPLPPGTPSKPTPPNGAVHVSVNTGLSWECISPNPEVRVLFDVYFGEKTPPPLAAGDYGSKVWKIDPEACLKSLTKYYWKIVAKTVSGGGGTSTTEGPIWSFTTGHGQFLGKWGTKGTGNGEFNYPNDIAVNSAGRVYVSDALNNRVQYFTDSGSFLGKWGSRGTNPGQFYEVRGLAVAPDGNIYVTDTQNERVQYFSASGNSLGQWDSPGLPTGLGIASNGNVYVTDSSDTSLIRYYTRSGSLLGSWGGWGRQNGQFQCPDGLAVARNGNVYVVDALNHRVQYFTPSGSFLGAWGKRGRGEGAFTWPDGIAISAADIIYVTDYNNRVQYFTNTGSFLGQWGSYGSGDGEFNEPMGLDISSDGKIYVGDWENFRVQYFR